MGDYFLGISAFYHDAAAAVVKDGQILAAAQQERFSRRKHDAEFPAEAINFVLAEAGVTPEKLQAIVFYDKPLLKFERLLETYHAFAPAGLSSFLKAMPIWLKDKFFFKRMLRRELKKLGLQKLPLLFGEHHLSHAASAFYPSPFDQAAILTIDGVGEWATTTIGLGSGAEIEIVKEVQFPHSLGLFYSAITYYLGFKVNSGEYKVMGLAPYGEPDGSRVAELKERLLAEVISVKEDGSFFLNLATSISPPACA